MSPPSPTLAIFTAAQRRVLDLMAGGHSYPEIARLLGITAWTARHHMENAGNRVPETFYPAMQSAPHRRARLMMYYALAQANDQYQLVA